MSTDSSLALSPTLLALPGASTLPLPEGWPPGHQQHPLGTLANMAPLPAPVLPGLATPGIKVSLCPYCSPHCH